MREKISGGYVMACDDEVIPLRQRNEAGVDDADLEEVHNTERHLLYVACTRARDHLLITGSTPHRNSWMICGSAKAALLFCAALGSGYLDQCQ
jgi:ATP-dependent exoDNAse (exonuclease V) beta subunit